MFGIQVAFPFRDAPLYVNAQNASHVKLYFWNNHASVGRRLLPSHTMSHGLLVHTLFHVVFPHAMPVDR